MDILSSIIALAIANPDLFKFMGCFFAAWFLLRREIRTQFKEHLGVKKELIEKVDGFDGRLALFGKMQEVQNSRITKIESKINTNNQGGL